MIINHKKIEVHNEWQISCLRLTCTAENLPPYHYAPIFNHTQVLHPRFGEVFLSIAADHNQLFGIFHQEPVSVTGHFDSSTAAAAAAETQSVSTVRLDLKLVWATVKYLLMGAEFKVQTWR